MHAFISNVIRDSSSKSEIKCSMLTRRKCLEHAPNDDNRRVVFFVINVFFDRKWMCLCSFAKYLCVASLTNVFTKWSRKASSIKKWKNKNKRKERDWEIEGEDRGRASKRVSERYTEIEYWRVRKSRWTKVKKDPNKSKCDLFKRKINKQAKKSREQHEFWR